MKKLVLLLAVVFGMSMVSCNDGGTQTGENTETAPEVTEQVQETVPSTPDSNAMGGDSAALKVQEDTTQQK